MENSTMSSAEGLSSGEGMIDVIKPETLVSVPMSSGYYRRIQDILGFMINGKSTEELNDAHSQINSQEVTDEWVTHYETLLILAREFEELARKEGFVAKVSREEAERMLSDML